MIIVKVIGGLGNQLFQIALAVRLAKQLNKKIFVDLSYYTRFKIRSYSISNFTISKSIERIDGNIRWYKLFRLRFYARLYQIMNKLNKILLRKESIGEKIWTFLSSKGLYFNLDRYYYPIVHVNHDIIYIYGYFQSLEYFKDIKNIHKIFNTIITENYTYYNYYNKISESNSVAISIRLGEDYIKSKDLNIHSNKYFYSSINYIRNRVENPIFFIFSDEIEKAKLIFSGQDNLVFIQKMDDVQSLALMKKCKHFIISNSSFSWWGSYLSHNQDKIIIAPKKWYTNSMKKPGIYYDSMIKIDIGGNVS